MRMRTNYTRETLVYPGEYIPLVEVDSVGKQLDSAAKEDIETPPVNMDEFDQYYKLSIVLPGVGREHISIRIQENILSVIVLHKDYKYPSQKTRIHEFNTQYFERYILLPQKADPELVSAEYKDGLLQIFISKTPHKPVRTYNPQIVVY